MRARGRYRIGERGLAAGLAMLALLVQVLVPQGFMVARQGDGPTIVICTGHGPVLGHADLGGPAKAPKGKPDVTCAFAGHGVGVAAAVPIAIATATTWSSPDLIAAKADLAPGRGLAAPPPPSQAPPPPLS